ncbi:MAG: alpha-glucuronidase [Acidobacteriota bacterium]
MALTARAIATVLACAAFLATPLHAESGRDAWLRYARVTPTAGEPAASLPSTLTVFESTPSILRARDELVRGLHGMLQADLHVSKDIPAGPSIVIGTVAALRQFAPALAPAGGLAPDGFWIRDVPRGSSRSLVIAGESERAVLYGSFALLRRIAAGERLTAIDQKEEPYAPQRWVNEWDNIDGTIERGYGGRSIFWDNGKIRDDLTRVGEYGRLLASVGINGISINNVNANRVFLSPELVPQVARVAEALRPWGVRVALAVDFGSPSTLGGLPTFDPLDASVAAWWRARADALYAAIPDFAGFVLKADSEGRVGPSTYGRTHADAANVVARALKPHGGVIFYRGFVYDHHMDWTNAKNDRARAAYDNFHPLDGTFDDNVIVQIKHGPIDFQVREPASPLFGALEKTNEAIELQITQEYFGQARHTVFLVPMWKEALDFDLRVREGGTPVKALAAGRTFHRPAGGFAGVANVGLDDSWLGNHLSQANLYGFGRLAWNPDLSARAIVEEWTRATFGNDPHVVETVIKIQLDSWRTYENYTGPFGLQTLTDIVGNHYGVAVEASERNGWGQWHRADANGVGMDRTTTTGTGYIGQYSQPVRSMYDSLDTCPDELLLFMHHVPYTHRLHNGKTVIQAIYDAHYDGAGAVAGYEREWRSLERLIDPERFDAVAKQLEYQAGHAVVWRDAVSRWFLRASGIADSEARVGHYPGRVEAESMTLTGYAPVTVTPWEAASGDGAVSCVAASCSAAFIHRGVSGPHDIVVQYFDVNTGAATFRLRVGDRVVEEWTAADRLPTKMLDGSSSTRHIARRVALSTGDRIQIEAVPDGEEAAALDYVQVQPSSGDGGRSGPPVRRP